ncbi:hypothetical protein D9758_016846 [Tetrapyrgos nigripes]|uniref:Zn-dependent exopeptidase n=1 Tax=Tetrapyrgos nigripes TaxID=182062 RepID=A0A8H5FKY2_9AGAR|nr:hypothetical protein D9758_016846 [Tetrapyrgos nigripes]
MKELPLHSVPVEGQRRRFRYLKAILLLAGLYTVSSFFSINKPVQHAHIHTEQITQVLSTSERESLFLSIPSGSSAHATAKKFASKPHVAGSDQDFENAKEILKLFQRELGASDPPAPPHFPPEELPIYDAGTPRSRSATISLASRLGPRKPTAWIDVYHPYFDTPDDRSLDILNEEGVSEVSLDLVEDGDPLDEDAAEYRDSVPAWHGLSGHGEAEGELIYVNYGTFEDFEELTNQGVNFTGKITIARYGAIYRGLKVKRAQELGASGVLIYSDPRDDGYVTTANGFTPYPHGPARNPASFQRGSVMYLSMYPGDPTTPGRPAYPNAERDEPKNAPTIPSLPVSWANAERLLEEIGDIYTAEGKLSGKTSTKKVRMVNHVNRAVTPIWNTMAAIPGHVRNEIVLVGCHRDAWVLGAADPISGTAALSEIVRGFGELLRSGWNPLRTIIIASWDGEEHGLLGSTEYGEDFADFLAEYVVSYINVDVSSSGSRWSVSGSPSLAHLIRKTAGDVPHPTEADGGKTLWDARQDDGPFHESFFYNASAVVDAEVLQAYETEKAKQTVEEESGKTGVNPLGSGSDYTVFLQRIGIAATDQGFTGTPYDAPYHYHSIYDSVRWQEVYADPGYKRHAAIAKHLGLMSLRLTDGIILPLNTTQYAFELNSYLDVIESLPLPSNISHSDLAPDFARLRASFARLQGASIAMDKEKKEAEKKFLELLEKMPRFPGVSAGKGLGGSSGLYHSFKDAVKKLFGVSTPRALTKFYVDPWYPTDWVGSIGFADDEEMEVYAGWLEYRLAHPLRDHHCAHTPASDVEKNVHQLPKLPIPPIREFLKAAKRVSKANKKLMVFERGFISEEGIPDREWYRHLGVAPGKWLGYGATTLPALTEAITIDKDVERAKYEVERLVGLVDKMVVGLMP